MAETIRKFFAALAFTGILAACLTALSGCADDPSPVGSFFYPGSDLVNVDSLTLVSNASSGEKAVPYPFAANRSTIALGRTSDGFEAWAFLLFYGYPDSLTNATINGAEVRLQKAYSLGDSTAAMSFTVHKGLREWNRNSFVYDSLPGSGVYDPSGLSPTVSENSESIRFEVDPSFVHEWVLASSDTAHKNFGIVLEPGVSNLIRGFRSIVYDSVNERPTLTIRYTMSGGTQEDTLVVLTAVDRFVAGAVDTTFLGDSTLIPVRGGAAYRGLVGVDVSTVPPHAAIHRAYLDVRLDSASSNLVPGQDRSLLALYAGVRNQIQTGSQVSGDTLVYRFNVTEFIQSMVRGTGKSSIRIAVQDEQNAVGLFMIHGAAAPAALRPKITVLYSPTR